MRGLAGVPAKQGKEGDEGLGGPKDEEPDAASRRLAPQPKGLSAEGSLAVSARSDDGPASPLTRLRAIKPSALNAVPGEYLDGLQGSVQREAEVHRRALAFVADLDLAVVSRQQLLAKRQ